MAISAGALSALGALGSGAISSVGSITGGLLGAKQNYKYSKQLAEDQFNYNKELGKINQKYAREILETENAYNVANAQKAQEYAKEANEWNRQNTKDYYNLMMQGAIEAGVNPMMAIGGAGGTAGTNAATIAGSSGGSGNAGGAGLASADGSILGQGIMAGSKSIADSYSQYLDNEIKEAKVKQIEAETGESGSRTTKNITENKLIEAQIPKVKADAEKVSAETKNLDVNRQKELNNIVIQKGGAWAQKLGTDLYLTIMGKYPDEAQGYRVVEEILGSNVAKGLGGAVAFTKMANMFKKQGVAKEIKKIFDSEGKIVGGNIVEKFFS